MKCRLCDHEELDRFECERFYQYYHCLNCDYIFKDTSLILSHDKEKARYDCHQNSLTDTGYRNYLEKILKYPLEDFPHGQGVDFGCGPERNVELLLKDQLNITSYDPYYFCVKFDNENDFFIINEVIEHITSPLECLIECKKHLKEKSAIYIRTVHHSGPASFKNWWYKNDTTHIGFFNMRSFSFIASQLNMTLVFLEKDIIKLVKE